VGSNLASGWRKQTWRSSVIGAVLVCSALSFYRAGSVPLNFDEAFVAWLSALQGAEKVYVISVDLLHPPCVLSARHVDCADGNSELSLRLLPGLFNVLMVPLVAQFARLAGNRSVGQFAAWLWAVLPVPILHAHYDRQHSLAVLFAALSAWCCSNLMHAPVALVGGDGLFNVLGVYTIYAHFFVVFLEGLCWFCTCAARRAFSGLAEWSKWLPWPRCGRGTG